MVKYKAEGEFKALSHTAQLEKGNHRGLLQHGVSICDGQLQAEVEHTLA